MFSLPSTSPSDLLARGRGRNLFVLITELGHHFMVNWESLMENVTLN